METETATTESLRAAAAHHNATNQDYWTYIAALEQDMEREGETTGHDVAEDDHLEADYEDEFDEPDLDFGFECDSAFESIGWGDDY